jgi:hypothetical protein
MDNEDKKDFAGKNGFTWWVGIVEDRQDPLKLGRCRVRCVGWHAEDKMNLPTKMLPWALPSYPVNQSQTYTPKEGDMVFGFFTDGDNGQSPVMLGIFPSIPLKAANIQEAFSDPRTDEQLANSPREPKLREYGLDGLGVVITEKDKAELYPRILDEPTTSRIARNDEESITKTYIQEKKDFRITGIPTVNGSYDEPETKYNAKYPYNNVMETESGHIQEFDDTPGAERIHTAHRSGTFEEVFPDGSVVHKIVKDNYTIVMKDDHLYVLGKCNITVQGDAEIYVQKNAYAKIDGNLKGQVGGNADVNIDGNVNVTVGGNYNEKVGGTYKVQSGGNMSFNAPRVDIN